MSPDIYLDECVNRHLARLLRSDGIDATTASEARTLGYDDEAQLRFASRAGRVLLTHNQRHFQRLHERFLSEGRSHAGIMLIPNGPLPLVALRALMLVSWVQMLGSVESRLVRRHDCQGQLIHGMRLEGFSEAEVRQALAQAPTDTES